MQSDLSILFIYGKNDDVVLPGILGLLIGRGVDSALRRDLEITKDKQVEENIWS